MRGPARFSTDSAAQIKQGPHEDAEKSKDMTFERSLRQVRVGELSAGIQTGPRRCRGGARNVAHSGRGEAQRNVLQKAHTSEVAHQSLGQLATSLAREEVLQENVYRAFLN